MSLFDSLLARALPFIPRPIVGRFAAPYVAGESTADAFAVVRSLNARGMCATLDVLGEDVTELGAARAAAGAYVALLDDIAREGLDSNVSLKLSQFGLKLDRKQTVENLRRVLEAARRHGNFVRIDMEDASTTDATLEIWRDLVEDFPRTGVVLQASLRRTLDDARALAAVRAPVRVCKGIYVESPELQYRDRERVRESFMATVEVLLRGGSYVGIATHDEVLVDASETLVRDLGLPREGRYEFQMLLGVRETLRDAIRARGHKLRVYVPFGDQWYAYSLRRLRENPAIARHVALAVLRGEARKARRG